MSTASTISENIEGFAEDEASKQDSDNGKEIDGLQAFGSEDVMNTESPDLKTEDTSFDRVTEEESEIESVEDCRIDSDNGGSSAGENVEGTDLNGARRQAIEKFSSVEAEKIIKEAILIKHVLDEDKTQFLASNETVVDKLTGGKSNGESYDRYLIDKLLHSEPDPSEETFERFEGLDSSELKNDEKLSEKESTEVMNDTEYLDASGDLKGM